MDWQGQTLMEAVGRMLLTFGVLFVILGLTLVVLGRVPLVGRLPGDMQLSWKNLSCYFPIMSGIVLSIVATIVLNLIIWLLRR